MIQKIKEQKKKAIKENDKEMKTACNMILGELARMPDKNISDSQITNIINKLIKSEMIMLEYSGQDINEYVKCLKSFLPEQVSENKIKEFIKTVDFSKLKNKMQAVGIVKKHFGDSVDGNLVKNIIQEM